MNSPILDYFRCPIHSQTFRVKKIKTWVEQTCEGRTLNLFSGTTLLNIDEVRNDKDTCAIADYHMDAVQFCEEWRGEPFNTILLDPPYSYRKSMEYYHGNLCSPFKILKDSVRRIIAPNGIVICFGYHSNTMGKDRGFIIERIGLFSHGGAIHDTIASVERRVY